MWTKLVSSWVTSTYRRKVNYRCLVRAGICAQATIQSSLFHKSCFTSKLHVSNSIYYQTIWSNVRAYATRNKKYVPNSNSFLRRIPREAWILLLLGISGGVVYGWSKKLTIDKFDKNMDEIDKIIKAARASDVNENQKELSVKLYKEALLKVKLQIDSEQSLQRMSTLTTKLVFIIDQLANIKHGLGKLKEAEDYYKQTLQVLLSHGASKDDDAVIEISLKLASIYAEEGRYDLAEEGYSWCVENARKKVSDTRRSDTNSLALFGICLESYGRYRLSRKDVEKARSLFSEALVVSRNIFGEKHEQVVLLLNNLGVACFEGGDMEHSKRFFNEAINLSTEGNQENLWSFHLNLGNVLAQTGNIEEAKNEYNQALQLCQNETLRRNIKDQLLKFP